MCCFTNIWSKNLSKCLSFIIKDFKWISCLSENMTMSNSENIKNNWIIKKHGTQRKDILYFGITFSPFQENLNQDIKKQWNLQIYKFKKDTSISIFLFLKYKNYF